MPLVSVRYVPDEQARETCRRTTATDLPPPYEASQQGTVYIIAGGNISLGIPGQASQFAQPPSYSELPSLEPPKYTPYETPVNAGDHTNSGFSSGDRPIVQHNTLMEQGNGRHCPSTEDRNLSQLSRTNIEVIQPVHGGGTNENLAGATS